MKDRIKDYFAFSKKEQRGLIVLLGLMLLALSANIFIPYFLPEKEYDIGPYKKEVEEFLASLDTIEASNDNPKKKFYASTIEKNERELQAFLAAPYFFNPNEISSNEWNQMGLNDKVAGNILRYREKGGVFRNKEGFGKIYGMTDKIFSILGPYLKFPEDEGSKPVKYQFSHDSMHASHLDRYPEHQPEFRIIELNEADSAILLELDGIGPSFAGRIIKYRDRLGGYFKKEQLLEIKGMDTLRFDQVKEQVTIDTSRIRKININAVTFKDLLKHPYFEYYLVKAIFNKKDELKRFESVGQLKEIPVMYEELFERISPYLVVMN